MHASNPAVPYHIYEFVGLHPFLFLKKKESLLFLYLQKVVWPNRLDYAISLVKLILNIYGSGNLTLTIQV